MKYPGKFWDEYFSAREGLYTLLVKRCLGLCGRRIDLHKMTAADDPECFHTHPANAIRIILWGGYVEEVPHGPGRRLRKWLPGMAGLIRPEFTHRVHRLCNGDSSYSLWLRGKVTHPVRLIGRGWGADEHRSTDIE